MSTKKKARRNELEQSIEAIDELKEVAELTAVEREDLEDLEEQLEEQLEAESGELVQQEELAVVIVTGGTRHRQKRQPVPTAPAQGAGSYPPPYNPAGPAGPYSNQRPVRVGKRFGLIGPYPVSSSPPKQPPPK